MVNPSMTPLEALQTAMKREIGAEEFYVKAAQSVEDESARKMFEFLAEEERKHQRRIQEEIDRHFLKEM